jgi:hypothetical protein
MIIRALGDGQYRVDSTLFDTLNEIDNRVVEAVQRGDQEEFESGLAELIGCIQRNGQRVADAELLESDIIVPPADLTLAEARDVFRGTGVFEG